MDFLNPDLWVNVGKIILVDIILAGDNAVVIGMAASKLAPNLQRKAILWGTGGAIGIRFIAAFLLVEALKVIPALHLVGGLFLLWIAVKLLSDDSDDINVKSKDSLKDAIFTIIMSDALMSIDNVMGVVGAAGGNFTLVLLGMLISVPIIIFSSSIIAKFINKYPIILYFGAIILGWVAGEMIVADGLVSPRIEGYDIYIQIFCAIFVLVVAKLMKEYKARKRTEGNHKEL